MPNWACTTYKCVGDLKDVEKLHEALINIDAFNTTIVKNGFGKRWLGNLVTILGYDWKEYCCRGEIIDYSLYNNVLTIHQLTAWGEQEGVRKCIEQTFPSIKVYYLVEEPGCEVFCTNDNIGEYFPDRYFLDCNDEPQYWQTIEEAAKWVSELVNRSVEATFVAIEDALDQYSQKLGNLDDCFYSFHAIDVVD